MLGASQATTQSHESTLAQMIELHSKIGNNK
jgi:hypothetical protein